jgi:hypothetical protein
VVLVLAVLVLAVRVAMELLVQLQVHLLQEVAVVVDKVLQQVAQVVRVAVVQVKAQY